LRAIRDFLTFVALLALGGITLNAAVAVVRQGWPTGQDEVSVDVWAALTQEDLSAADVGRRRALVRRIERDLDDGTGLQPTSNEPTPDERQRLQGNLACLAQQWLYDQSQRYAALPGDQREQHLDALVETWSRRRRAVEQSAERTEGSAQLGDAVLMTILVGPGRQWLAELSPEEFDRVQTFVADLRTRALVRGMAGAALGG
jgi:hypothetical protein